MIEGTDRFRREKWKGREGEGRETRGRDGGVCERDKERRRRKTDMRERQRWERDGGSLEVQGARTPQLFWIPGKWGWACPRHDPQSLEWLRAHSSHLPVPLQCPTDTLNLTSVKRSSPSPPHLQLTPPPDFPGSVNEATVSQPPASWPLESSLSPHK